ncbi:hypothetical protein CXB51_014612 [Gossypium anomalum]|uniref:Polygalacturonase n=1 Tax=Gossypium anomalum TaxID=47600 RepID=A0A8J5YKR7_9ROSI|nr:hypothetical protein CXB51_014612 [Gossypium anomalum]
MSHRVWVVTKCPSASKVQSDAIDVVAKFGAKADGKTNLSKPFFDAWKEACASVTPSTVGTIQAPTDPSAFKDRNWVRFYTIENFKMFGEGIFDGQGSIAYEKNTCDNREYPGIVSEIHFEDITVNNVSSPILIDQQYCPWNKCKKNEESKVKLSNISFKNIRGTSSLPEAVKCIWSGSSPCQNVELADIDIKYTGAEPATSQCLNVKPITIGKLNPIPCFRPVPKTPSATA